MPTANRRSLTPPRFSLYGFRERPIFGTFRGEAAASLTHRATKSRCAAVPEESLRHTLPLRKHLNFNEYSGLFSHDIGED